MANNATVELIGNLGSEVRIIETEERTFAAVSLATTDSYKKDDSDEWVNKETMWHDLIAFSPSVIEVLKGLNTKARVKVTGILSYRPFEVQSGEGQIITKKEASIIVRKVEQAPLPKKNKD
jgi:single-stranded DNA-binding protein